MGNFQFRFIVYLSFVLQRIEYKRFFFCSYISNYCFDSILCGFINFTRNQIFMKPLKVLQCIFHIFQKIFCKYTTNFFSSNCHNLVKFEISKTIRSFKPNVISKSRNPYNIFWTLV